MNKEILEKINEIKTISNRYKGFNSIADRVEELEQLIKAEEPQKKPECDFLPGQVLKVWDDNPENWKVDIFEKYYKDAVLPFKCIRYNWKHAEPLPLKNHIANIAYYMPDAVKAEVSVNGYIDLRDAKGLGIMIENTGYFYRIPYPNNTGKDIEIDIKR
jgi:hypothetical protein